MKHRYDYNYISPNSKQYFNSLSFFCGIERRLKINNEKPDLMAGYSKTKKHKASDYQSLWCLTSVYRHVGGLQRYLEMRGK